MRELALKTDIYSFHTFDEFVMEFQLDGEDLIITNRFIIGEYIEKNNLLANVIYQEDYGQGEPTDEMFEALYADIAKMSPHRRIIGIGGGTVLDLSKLFALRYSHPVIDLFEHKLPIEKEKELILIPTTCGTGSEVTDISVLAFCEKNMKMGLAAEELLADKAILIPEFLVNLPYRFFATSSIDAFIHAVESILSPKATTYSELCGYRAVELILRGYQEIAQNGKEARIGLSKEFLIAANLAGIAFGTAGCGSVHALSYPLSGTFHVAHGEANYSIFAGVMKRYQKITDQKQFLKLKEQLSAILNCRKEDVLVQLETLLNHIITKKNLKEYGADENMLQEWSRNVLETQQRLMKNSPIFLGYEDILEIYQTLYE